MKTGPTEPIPTEPHPNMEQFNREMAAALCDNYTETFTGTQDPVARELIDNDGQSTILVKSTNRLSGPVICREGLRFTGAVLGDGTIEPRLEEATHMMAGPETDLPQEEVNTKLLNYWHDNTNVSGAEEKVKIVVRLPMERPEAASNKQACEDPRLQPGGPFVRQVGPARPGEFGEQELTLRIEPQFVMGYFNQTTGEFHANPAFGEAQRQLGRVRALGERMMHGLFRTRGNR